MLDQILLDDSLKNAESQEELHASRARLDKLYDTGVMEGEPSDKHDVPSELLYDVESMDPEYVRKAMETQTNQKTDLNYVTATENGFSALGALGAPLK